MSHLEIRGGVPLSGRLRVQGAKNSVLPILAAALLAPGQSILHNCPRLADVEATGKILRLLGCDTLIVTNAAGCVHQDWNAGDIMLICDQIKLGGESPLRGENLPQFGVRFPDASTLYTPHLQQVARDVAKGLGTPLREGVYYYSFGPQYETPAEIRAIRALGGDAVGMSTAPEVIVAAHCGMEVLGFSLLSNLAAGMLPKPLSEEEVLEAGKAARHRFVPLVLGCLAQL